MVKLIVEIDLLDEGILTGKEINDRFHEFEYNSFIAKKDIKRQTTSLYDLTKKTIFDNIDYVCAHPLQKFLVISPDPHVKIIDINED